MKLYNTPTVPCKKSKIVSFTSSILKNIVVLSLTPLTQFRFPPKLTCCIAFESALSGCCLPKSTAIIL